MMSWGKYDVHICRSAFTNTNGSRDTVNLKIVSNICAEHFFYS